MDSIRSNENSMSHPDSNVEEPCETSNYVVQSLACAIGSFRIQNDENAQMRTAIRGSTKTTDQEHQIVGNFIALLVGIDSDLASWNEITRTFSLTSDLSDIFYSSKSQVSSIVEKYLWHAKWMREIHDYTVQNPDLATSAFEFSSDICFSPTQTQKALRSSFRIIYCRLFSELVGLEELLLEYEDTQLGDHHVVYRIINFLSGEETLFVLQRIEALCHLFSLISLSTNREPDPQVKCTQIINHLYQAIASQSVPSYALSIYWTIFVGTLKPLFDFLEAIMYCGVSTDDIFAEFPFRVNQQYLSIVYGCHSFEDLIDAPNFWLKCAEFSGTDDNQIGFLSRFISRILSFTRSCIMSNLLQETQYTCAHLLTGRLYAEFCASCDHHLLAYSPSFDKPVRAAPSEPTIEKLCGRLSEYEKQSLNLLMPCFADYSIFDPISFFLLDVAALDRVRCKDNEVVNFAWDQLPLVSVGHSSSLPPRSQLTIRMDLLVERAFQLSIEKMQYNPSIRLVRELVIPRCDSLLASVHNHFLMLDGHAMSIFCDQLFTLASSSTPSLVFELCSVQFDKNTRSFVTMYPTTVNTVVAHPQDLLKHIRLICSGIKWPCSMLLTSKNMDQYSQAFQFLLKLSFARWSLCQVRLSDVRGCDSRLAALIQQSSLIKFSLQQSLQTFEMQIMSRIFAIKTDFFAECNTAHDFNEILSAHSTFLMRLSILTSQTGLVSAKKTAMRTNRILENYVALSSDLRALWNSIVHDSHDLGSFDFSEVQKSTNQLRESTNKCIKLTTFISSF